MEPSDQVLDFPKILDRLFCNHEFIHLLPTFQIGDQTVIVDHRTTENQQRPPPDSPDREIQSDRKTTYDRPGQLDQALTKPRWQIDQPAEFVRRISTLIPLGRMATPDEYRSAVQFLCSDASAFLTGQNIVVDDGRSGDSVG